jgi:hypothetical protein
VLPLGTGNDLARVLGWGSVVDNQAAVSKLLDSFEKATTKMLDRWSILTYTNDVNQKESNEDDEETENLEYFENIEKLVDYELYSLLTHNDDDEALLQSTVNLKDLIEKLIDHNGRQDLRPLIRRNLDRLFETLRIRFVYERETPKAAVNESNKNKYQNQVLRRMENFKEMLKRKLEAKQCDENDEDEDDDDEGDRLFSFSAERTTETASVKSHNRNLTDYNDDNIIVYEFGDDDDDDGEEEEDYDEEINSENQVIRRTSALSIASSTDVGSCSGDGNKNKHDANKNDSTDGFSVPLASSEEQSHLSTPKSTTIQPHTLLSEVTFSHSKPSHPTTITVNSESFPAKTYLAIPSLAIAYNSTSGGSISSLSSSVNNQYQKFLKPSNHSSCYLGTGTF